MFTSLCVFEEGLQDVTVRQLKKKKRNDRKSRLPGEESRRNTQPLKHPQGTAFMLSLRDPDTLKAKDGGGEQTLLSRTYSLHLLSRDSE